MTCHSEVAAPDETVLYRFRDDGFRHLPVVDGECLLGTVSDRDVLRTAGPSLGPTMFEDDLGPGGDRTLREVMTRDVVPAVPTMSVEEAADTMLRENVSAIPVSDEGRLIGIVTTGDVLRLASGVERDQPPPWTQMRRLAGDRATLGSRRDRLSTP